MIGRFRHLWSERHHLHHTASSHDPIEIQSSRGLVARRIGPSGLDVGSRRGSAHEVYPLVDGPVTRPVLFAVVRFRRGAAPMPSWPGFFPSGRLTRREHRLCQRKRTGIWLGPVRAFGTSAGRLPDARPNIRLRVGAAPTLIRHRRIRSPKPRGLRRASSAPPSRVVSPSARTPGRASGLLATRGTWTSALAGPVKLDSAAAISTPRLGRPQRSCPPRTDLLLPPLPPASPSIPSSHRGDGRVLVKLKTLWREDAVMAAPS